MSTNTTWIGLDIGGTKFIACAAGADGQIRSQVQAAAPLGLAEGLALLNGMITDVLAGEAAAAIGCAIGGPIDWARGVVSPLHQPEWRQVPLRKILEEHWGCPVAIDVDTNMAALGEYTALAAKPQRLLYITVSTGMGGGLLVGGEVYRGAGYAHPEIAHQTIATRCSRPERAGCECGLPDCLEGLVSGNAIRRIYGKPAEDLDEDEWQEVGYNLGQGLRNAAALYAPDLIVLGGGVAIGRGERLAKAAEKVMRDHLRIVPAPEVGLSVLGYYTPLYGAVESARRLSTGKK